MSQTDQPNYSSRRPILERLRQARFTQLLIALSLLLFAAPFVGVFQSSLGQTLASLLILVLLAAVLISAGIAVAENQRQARVISVLAILCVALVLLATFVESRELRLAQNILTIGFLAQIVRLIVRRLFQPQRVDHHTISASLCGYLLIGVAFAVVYTMVMDIDPDAVRISSTGKMTTLGFGNQHTSTSLYFSFVTLTTLGYGDITTQSPVARMLTTSEALIGQLYLVVLVARLVGLHIAGEMPQQPQGE